jgi:spore coat polysaccharide biosynthesis protein SpsF (cytidylyltransferase family)
VTEPVAGALAVVQARMSSSRLPGKVLADVGGEPALALLLARLSGAGSLDRVVVATSDGGDDDAVAEEASRRGADVHRGPLDDVLARFSGAIQDHAGVVVRITADCPLVDPALVDAVVALLRENPEAVYASNVEPRSFPVGLDVEAIRAQTLRDLAASATAAEDREHVTLAIRRDPDLYPRETLTSGRSGLESLRWTVDTADDLERVRAIVAALGERRYTAGWEEILALPPAYSTE